MASGSPRPMTAQARAAFEVYRDLGRGRTLKAAARLLSRHPTQLRKWSAKHEWQRLCAEHDHAALKESLGQREVTREHGTQRMVDWIDDAAQKLYDTMMDDRQLPILDRQGKHATDADDNKLYKPLVKPSTQVVCATTILGIAGLVQVKRVETIDRSGEQLDEAASVMAALPPAAVLGIIAALDKNVGTDST